MVKTYLCRQRFAWLLRVIATLVAVLLSHCHRESTASRLPLCKRDGKRVRNITEMPLSDFNRSGLSHLTVAGGVQHGTQEVEVWMQNFAPGSGTPIHRHHCEEVFVVLEGSGILRYALDVPSVDADGKAETSGFPREVVSVHIWKNMTFTVPPNLVHQIRNDGVDDGSASKNLQLLVVISQPPIHVYAYPSWNTSHDRAASKFPYPWDNVCL